MTGCADCIVRVFDVRNGRLTYTLTGHTGSVERLELSCETLISVASDL